MQGLEAPELVEGRDGGSGGLLLFLGFFGDTFLLFGGHCGRGGVGKGEGEGLGEEVRRVGPVGAVAA